MQMKHELRSTGVLPLDLSVCLKTFKANFYSSQKHINLVTSVCGPAIRLFPILNLKFI